MNVAIILGYGIFTDDNPAYKAYLDEVIALDRTRQFDVLIFCGGFTNPTFNLSSEAASMATYYTSKAQERKPTILLEEESLTTPDNLKNASQLLKTQSITPQTITLTCDSIRIPKAYYLARLYLGRLLQMPTDDHAIYADYWHSYRDQEFDVTTRLALTFGSFALEGIPLDLSPKAIGRQISSAMLETQVEKYPDLNEEFLNYRRKKFGLVTTQR